MVSVNIKWKYTLKTKKMILKGESAEEFNRKEVAEANARIKKGMKEAKNKRRKRLAKPPQTVEKWEDFELYDVFETAIQESALTVVTKYHNLDEETTELALECVRIFRELAGTTDQNKEDDNSTDNFNSNSVPSV
jgi:hypothetical protein